MSKLKQFALNKDNAFARLLILFVLPAFVIAAVSLTAYAQNIYVIYDGGQTQYVTTASTEPADVLAEAGIELDVDDTFLLNEKGVISQITVQRVQLVYINNGGRRMVTGTYGETVGELLDRVNLSLNEGDSIDVDLSAATFDGMELKIDRRTTVTETYTEAIAFETEYVDESLMLEGDEKVITEGIDGEVLCTANVTYLNGQEISRQVISSEQTVAPVNQVIARGTLAAEKGKLTIGDGVIVTADGEVYTYTDTMKVKATAYTHTDAGCNKTTATGTTVHWGTVAVDPRMIPYGTKMFIVSNDGEYVYGLSAAEDCGGAIKGNRIDLYMPTTSECFAFGVRNCTVYILG